MNKKYLFWIVIFLFLISGCNTSEPISPAATAIPTAVPPTNTPIPPTIAPPPTVTAAIEEEAAEAPTAATAVATDAETAVTLGGTITTTVTITASDDLPLQATYFAPVNSALRPAVILLHMFGSNREAWLPTGLPQQLVSDERYHVLALDMRGHGATGGAQDWPLAEEDIQLVWQWLVDQPGVDGTKTAVVGASIGANMALRTGATIESINTVVLLSPGLDYFSVTTEDALERYGERPLLIVASQEDRYAANSSQTLADQAQGPAQLQMYTAAGHGTNMFNTEPELTPLIADWLANHWQ